MGNIYFADRAIRTILAVIFLYLSNFEFNIYLMLAIMSFITSATEFCPLYKAFNINKDLAVENKFLTKLPKHNPEPVFIFSIDGSIAFQNDASKQILPDIKDFKKLLNANPKELIASENKLSVKYEYKDTVYMIEAIGVKQSQYIFAYGFNITNLEENRKILEKQKLTDSLTNLGNREKLKETISKIEKNNISLLIFDIVKFSQINGFFGHERGDLFLKELAIELDKFKKSLDIKSHTFRLRGNTFALLLEFSGLNDINRDTKLKQIKQSLFTEFNNFKINVNNFSATAEIRVGIASRYECNKDDISTSLLNNAETALSEAKKDNLSFLYYKDIADINERYKENLKWAGKLYDIFDNKSEAKIKAYFQPIYNLHTKKIEKFEALVRIEEKDEVISPFKFLDIAKQINYLPKITKEVGSQAMEIFKGTDYEFSLNLTTQDLADEGFIDWLTSKVHENGFKTSSIVLEILEDEDIYEFTNTINEFKNRGFKLAIDDFGVGYSNFKKLQLLHVDYIKIDGSLVKNIAKNPKDLSIINSICTYAKVIGVKTIAEFVADEEIFELIKKTGVDYVQGYHISAPKPDIKVKFNDK